MHIELSTEQIEYFALRKAEIVREMDVVVGWRNEASVDEIITAAEAGNVTRYRSGCICAVCGTSCYDADVCRSSVRDRTAICCDPSEIFDTKEGYRQ